MVGREGRVKQKTTLEGWRIASITSWPGLIRLSVSSNSVIHVHEMHEAATVVMRLIVWTVSLQPVAHVVDSKIAPSSVPLSSP